MDHPDNWQAGFLAKLSPGYRNRMITASDTQRCRSGELLFHEGDPSLFFYIVKSGHVAIEVTLGGKGRQHLMTVGPGDVFSWSALAETRLETAAARAVDDVEVLRIKGGLLQDLCYEDPRLGMELYRALTEVVSARLLATRLQMLSLVAFTSEEAAVTSG